jgi:hypothetical protein
VTDPDSESAIVTALSRAARRTRLVFLVPGIVLGVAAIVPTFWLLTELQWLFMEQAFVLVSGGAAAGALLGCIVGARRLGDWMWDARRPSLCRRLSEAHGTPREDVEQLAQMFSSS